MRDMVLATRLEFRPLKVELLNDSLRGYKEDASGHMSLTEIGSYFRTPFNKPITSCCSSASLRKHARQSPDREAYRTKRNW
jgi:hypothetical protein